MSKGLEALHHPRIKTAKVDISAEGKHDIAYMFFDDTKQYTAIEKELKQAEENEKLLKVFKDALTIEYHEYPTIEQHNDNEDVMSYLVKELYTIRQSELEKNMRKALRKWVLKNVFPKELKALEIIKPFLKNIRIVKNEKGQYEVLIDVINSDRPLVIARINSQEEYELLKEVLL